MLLPRYVGPCGDPTHGIAVRGRMRSRRRTVLVAVLLFVVLGQTTDIARAAWPAPDAAPVAEIALLTPRPLQHHDVAFSAAASRDDATIGVFPWDLTYRWDFGDGSSSTDPAPTHVYADAGRYDVLLSVTDAAGSTDTVTRSVLVSPDRPPRVNWSPSTSKVVTDAAVTFTAGVADDGPVTPTCVWDFGDGTTMSSCTSAHSFLAPGAYDVIATAIDDAGQTTSMAKTITVRPNAAPSVAILSSTGRPTTGHALTLTGSGWDDSKIVSWAWDLDDGTTAATQNVTNKIYATPGPIDVTLVATDDSGASTTATMHFLVTADRVPRADIALSTARPFAGHSLTFTGGGWDETKISTWAWDFGDGTSSTKQSPAKTYARAGTYTVSLTVTDDTGHTATSTRSVMVAPDQAPRAAFGPSSSHPATGANVTLTNGSIDDASGLTYLWDFGDGTTSTATTPVKAWAADGTYIVSLRATDDLGKSATVVHELVVGGSVVDVVPLVDFKQNTARPIAGSTAVTFTTSGYVRDNATGLLYAWTFGDGGTSTATAPVYTFAAAGDYVVKLTVTDNTGNVASRTQAVHVDPNLFPYAYLSVTPGGTPMTGQVVTLSAALSKNDDAGTVNYTFSEDGIVLQSGTSTTLKRTYTTPGDRIVSIDVRDPKGNISSVTRLVPVDENVAPLAYASLSPGMWLLPGQAVTLSASSTKTDDGGALTYAWSVDGAMVQSGTSKSLVRSFADPGDHVISLVATDPFGLASPPVTHGVVVRADLPPIVNFTTSGSTRAIVGDTMPLTASVKNDDSAAVSYVWTVDGAVAKSGTSNTLSLTLVTPGEHAVTLIATDAAGNSSQPMTRVFFAEEDGAPTPTFLAPARVWSDETFSVDATGSTNDRAGALSCSWEWGDGDDDAGCTATHTYVSGGTYQITLTVRDVAGNEATDTRPVLVEQVPVARFSPPRGFANHAMTFDASDSDGPADRTFVWDFGGGELVTGEQAQHAYDADGAYAVTLRVGDPYGHESVITHIVDVSGDPRPIAAFDVPAGAPLPAETVSFNGSQSSDAGLIVAYRWTFGDGSTASGSRVAHAFAAAGTYEVALEIEDDAGLTDRLVRTIRVDDPPIARLAAPGEAFAGRPVTLDGTASSDAHGLASWSWSFGDGTSGSGATTGHAYATAGTYQVTLTVRDDDAHTDRRSVTIRISPDLPVGDLAAADDVTRIAPTLTWTAPVGVSVDRFRVYRDGIAIATTPTGNYVDNAALPDGDHLYSVTTLLASGDEGTASTAQTVRVDRTPPAAPTGLGATSPTSTAPDLAWSPVVDAGSDVATYVVFRNGIEIGRTSTTGYSDADVSEDGTYTYTVHAIDGAGNVGADATPFAVQVDTTPPGAPTGVVGQTPTALAPALSWTPVPATAAYRVYRAAALVATTANPAYSDTGVAEGRYTYTVSAVDASGNESALSPPRTIIYDTTPPGTPLAPTAASPTSSPVALAWVAAFDANGVDVYQVLRDGIVVASVRGQSWVDGASVEGVHGYALRAVDGAGNSSGTGAPVTVMYDTTAPSVPSTPTGPPQTRFKPAFSWGASTDAGSGVSVYRIYRGATLVGSTATATFTDSSVSTAGTYRYVVQAVDAAGNVSAASGALSTVYDTTAPTAPATPSATSPTRVRPVLSWSGGTDANGIDHYVVVRDGVDIGIAASPWTDTDPTLSDGTHLYVVRAVDPAGNLGSPSGSRAVAYDGTAPSAPGTITATSPTATAPALSWAPATDAIGVVRYDVFRDDSLVGTASGTTFTDSSVGEGTHVYTVRAADAAGNTGATSEARTVLVDATPPATPARPAGPATTNSTVTVSWTAVNDAGSGVHHYLVYRDAVVIATTSALAFADTALTADGAYAYTIAAVDAAGNVSARSAARVIVLDTTPPDTILAATADLTGPTVDFSFSASEPGSTFECSLDGGAWATCTTPLHVAGLESGPHAFEVRATDSAGNQAPDPARRSWVVDAVPPDPPVLTATADVTVPRSCRCGAVLLRLTAAPDVVRVRVTRPGRVVLDGAPSDQVDADVADGSSYAYQAVAYDAAGNASLPSGASVTTPDRTPPTAPAGPTGSGWPLAIVWPAVADADSYALRRDGTPLAGPALSGATDGGAADTLAPATPVGITAEPTSGTSIRVTWGAVADRGSTYRYAVAASDAAGNWSDWSAESELSIASGLDHYRVVVDGAAAMDVATPTAALRDLSPGTTHTVAIVAVDAAGNASPGSSVVSVSLPLTGVLVVAASARPQLARPGVPITFHADNAGVATATYRWAFDDGDVATGADATHAFAQPGRHVASLTVATPDGTSATASLEVIIDGRPPQARANVRGSRLMVEADDDLSGVASISFALGPGAPFAPLLDGGVSLHDGRYAVRVRTEDQAGNAAVSLFDALVDTSAPALRVRVISRRGSLVRVRITAADNGSGIRSVRLDRRSLATRATQVVQLRRGTRHVLVAADASGNVTRLPFTVPGRR